MKKRQVEEEEEEEEEKTWSQNKEEGSGAVLPANLNSTIDFV